MRRSPSCVWMLSAIVLLALPAGASAQVTYNGVIGPADPKMNRVTFVNEQCFAQGGPQVHYKMLGVNAPVAAPYTFSLTSIPANSVALMLYQAPFSAAGGANNCMAGSAGNPTRFTRPMQPGTDYVLVPVNISGNQSQTVSFSLTVSAALQKVADFSNDNRSDMVIVRGLGAAGPVRWWISDSSTKATTVISFGLPGDVPVPADYDGDGKADAAIWRPGPLGTAGFWITESLSGAVVFQPFGQDGDDPRVIGDYDGDGKCDIAIYRRSAQPGVSSVWYYRRSSDGAIGGKLWGDSTDYPAPGDYDGDGKHDFVVQRDVLGEAIYLMNQTTDGFAAVAFGLPGDVIAPGDYDGDGKTNLAIYRTGTGNSIQWWIRTADGVATPRTFGTYSTDSVVQGDYDGDGKTDIAVYRHGVSGMFWISRSTGGIVTRVWGTTGDYPAANWNVH